MRHRLTTKGGIAAVVAVLALAGAPSLLGVGGGSVTPARSAAHPSTAAGSAREAPSGTAAAVLQPRSSTVARIVPFTGLDLFLLIAGGGFLLVFGANLGKHPR